jgi:hypothetical protein
MFNTGIVFSGVIRNSSFEQKDIAGLPAYWKVEGNFSPRIDTVKHSGNFSVLFSPENILRPNSRISQKIEGAGPFHPVTVSGYIKTQDLFTQDLNFPGIGIGYKDGSGRFYELSIARMDKTTTDWTLVSISSIIPEEAKDVFVFLEYKSKSGNVWFDDIVVAVKQVEVLGVDLRNEHRLAPHNIIKFFRDVFLQQADTVGNVTSIGGNVNIKGNVTGSGIFIFCDVIIDGNIKGNVVAIGSNVQIRPNARINKDCIVIVGRYDRSAEAFIGGRERIFLNLLRGKNYAPLWQQNYSQLGIAIPIEFILWTGILIFYLIIVGLFKTKITVVRDHALNTPGRVFVIGLLSALLAAPVAMLLFISIIGILLLPIYFILLLAISIMGNIGVSLAVGKGIRKSFTANILKERLILDLFLGFLVIGLLQMLPIIGPFMIFFATSFSLGCGIAFIIDNRLKPQSIVVKPNSSKNISPLICFILGFSSIIPIWGLLLGILSIICGIFTLHRIKRFNLQGETFVFLGMGLSTLSMLIQLLILYGTH